MNSRHSFLRRISNCAHSLVELLVCVVIVALLSAISLTYYQGALDQSDLKYAAPALARRLNALREDAMNDGATIEVRFEIGEPAYHVTKRTKTGTTTETINMANVGLLKRPLRFRKYEWPDGATGPATFTFVGGATPSGGKVYLGTTFAETHLRVQGSYIWSDLQP